MNCCRNIDFYYDLWYNKNIKKWTNKPIKYILRMHIIAKATTFFQMLQIDFFTIQKQLLQK